jgi:ABC-2 type transport system permease protein
MRVLLVARTEFLAIVRGKAFIVGVLSIPTLIGLSIAFQIFAQRQADISTHHVAVVDHTGRLFEPLARAAARFNDRSHAGSLRSGPTFALQPVAAEADDGSVELALSDRVRAGELFAFVVIPAAVVALDADQPDQIRYYTETPSYSTLPNWLRTTIEREAGTMRYAAAALDADVVSRLSRPALLRTLGLISRTADGRASTPRPVGEFETFVLPFALMYLLFVAVISAAPQLLTAVVEEKMSRISEILIAAIRPAELMAGKLLGVSAVAALLALLYVSGAVSLAVQVGRTDLIDLRLFFWFVVFLLTAVLMFGAIFIAVGAACSDLKDAQNLMQPAMIFLLLPVLASPIIVTAPHAQLSVVLSLVPVATPFLMLVRLAMAPPPPLWQVLVALALTSATTAALVWTAGRIFRVGLLMQGRPPSLRELLRWIRQ